jgi:hypothetical protein
MRATTRKRLLALEAAAKLTTARPLVLIDVMKLPEADRDAYWSGDDVLLTRYGARDGDEAAPGTIHTLVISLHLESRREWLTTRDMNEEELEDHEQRQIHEEARREREAQAERERASLAVFRDAHPRAVIGYDREGRPVYDDDPRRSTNWVD